MAEAANTRRRTGGTEAPARVGPDAPQARVEPDAPQAPLDPEVAPAPFDTVGIARILGAIFLYYTGMGTVIPVLQRYIPGPLGAGTVAVSIIIGFAGGV